jgi:hypothetical protein
MSGREWLVILVAAFFIGATGTAAVAGIWLVWYGTVIDARSMVVVLLCFSAGFVAFALLKRRV